jgi:hypothetical protein
MNSNKVKDIKAGDIFSEVSHYKFTKIDGKAYKFEHLESGNTISLDEKYVSDLLTTADQYFSEEKVTKEDSKDGTKKGIRSLFEEIYDSQVFTVCFRKQDTPLSTKKLKELRDAQILEAVGKIESAAKSKKGVAEEAKKVIQEIQANPILPIELGEERILRGYKVQFSSRDGKYNCIDMDLVTDTNDLSKAIRPVNINTISWLVYKGVKYTVE